jgi:GTP-binding protein HflX
MTLLSKSDVFAENKLFATLDTTTRKVVFERMPFLLSDTVGFIRKLPHHLVESFKSTLDEVREADLLLHVVDISHNQYEDHIRVVQETLKELNAFDKPTIMVFNKIDAYETKHFDEHLPESVKKEIREDLNHGWQQRTNNKAVFISAVRKDNIDLLRYMMYDEIKKCYQDRYPYKTEFF